ncbi:DUF2142 domain-containing protein [Agromyces silvae]|uniref:DUF2142 domain-containing protein n=1 Tax=Agromyces silvae TaxID=3388266 RepID=UPI00280BAF02|nr:DUF2142 domain-containing protein [Agromyces protaetiae]
MSRLEPTPIAASPGDRPPRERVPRRVFAITWALASLLGILWAIATPVGASPDEPAHLVKAASVARGQFVGEPSSAGNIVSVPGYVAATHSVVCIVFQPNVAADCIDDNPADPSGLVLSTTTAGLYNPFYYAVVGWPSLLFGDVSGIYAMRIASAVLSALFLAFAASFAFGLGRRALTLAAIGVATVPTLLFMSGAVNPNAVEVTATMAAFTAMLAVVRRGAEGRIGGPLAVAAVSAAVGAQMRGLSPLWIALALAAPLLLVSWAQLRALLARRVVWVAIGAMLLGALLAVLWTLGSSSLTGSLSDEEHFQQYPGVGTSPLTGFVVTFLDTWDYGAQMIASFGWLDTPAPAVVYFVWSAFIGTLVLAAVAVLRGRRLGFAAALLAALLLLPPLVQAAYVTAGGYIWQGRYTLPLFAIAVIGVAVVLGERPVARARTLAETDSAEVGRASTRLFAVVWLAWGAAQFYAFAVAMKRYTVGLDGTWGAVLRAPEWAPPGGTVLLLGSFAVLALGTAFIAWWSTARPVRRPAVTAEPLQTG